MNYSFPRKKPSPVPKIIVTPEYLAKGSLKKSYINTRLAFNVPWMGVVAMAFAKYPFFYNSLWFWMVSCDFCIIPYGFVWFLMILYNSIWFCMVLNDFYINLYSFIWLLMIKISFYMV